ncbi:MAG: arsenate reductase ArsC [Methanomassiliicoccus sp.]|nr:arsenate reductase ArsC [Methanomassiliicoccus sp.]
MKMVGQDMDSPGPLRRVLFVCCHNSARSQMAEAILNARYGSRFEAFSAGTEPSPQVDPLAVKAMHEIGLDISGKRTKSVDEFIRDRMEFDYVVTTCYEARQFCPYIPAPEQVHARFDNPHNPAEGEDQLDAMRRVRDQIVDWVVRFFGPRTTLLELEKEKEG